MIDDHGLMNRDQKGVTLTLWLKTGLHPGSVSEVGRRGDGDGGRQRSNLPMGAQMICRTDARVSPKLGHLERRGKSDSFGN
jgi:hypothetical protein